MRFRLSIGCAVAALAAAGAAQAAPACTPEALNALKIPDLTVATANAVAATPQTPAHCAVGGMVVTRGHGAPDGSARFAMQLPDDWKQRFLFLGVGGNAGTLQPSANGVDRGMALKKGYATILTDTGHVGDGTSANWVRRPDGGLDQAKVTDFLFRAAHNVSVSGKAFAQAYYGGSIRYAYFDGCSTGGRMALASAIHFPGDYNGVISGDPAMDFDLNLARIALQKAVLSRPAGYMSEPLVAAIDARITARCDALDGARDGLVQDPTRCTVKPTDLQCKARQSGDCLNADQVAILNAYVSPLRDRRGNVIYLGWPIAHLVGNQGVSYYAFGKSAPNLADPAAPWGPDERQAPRSWRLGKESLSDWLGFGPSATLLTADVDADRKIVADDLIRRTRSIMGAGEGWDAAKVAPYLAGGGKLLLYHGASDPSIAAERSTAFFEDLMKQKGVSPQNARYFLVPGMHHCGGGAGPDQFKTLSALEAWVEQGKAPEMIMARSRPEAPVQRQIPLCPYPQQALYSGAGPVNDPANWSCKAKTSRKRL